MYAAMEGESLKMKTWNEISQAVNVTYEQTQQIDETAKIVGVSRREVLEALGISDEWAFVVFHEFSKGSALYTCNNRRNSLSLSKAFSSKVMEAGSTRIYE